MFKKFHKLFVAVATIAFLVQCANPGSPTGGPKDEEPPVMLSASPKNETVNFDSEKIEIKFDELVKFKDLKKQLVISPPMKHDPIIKPTGSAMDKVKIKILDTLAENTTYTINFGDALQDNNEGNIYSNFRYVFSTGDYIDSLKLDGKIADAFDDSFAENVMVMLYEIDSSFTDSTIFNELPTYITNTIKSDTFKIENAKAGEYLLIALEEKSKNLKFDPAQDKIAFYPEYVTLPDTNKYLLKLYKQVSDFKIKRPVHGGKGKISFKFDGQPKDIQIKRLLPVKSDTVMDLWYFSKYRDSINYWFSAREADSLQFLVKSLKYEVEDTVIVTLKKQKTVDASFSPTNKSGLTPEDTIEIYSNYPLLSFNIDSISVMNITDSAKVDVKITIEDIHKLKLGFVPAYKTKYSIKLMPGSITNFFGDINDTISFVSTVKSKTDYGEITLKVNNIASFPVMADVVTEKGLKIVKRIHAKSEQDFVFSNLKPGKYKLRLIYDDNGNEQWDPGNFLKQLMPEEVKYFPDVINLKANWDIQETWILND